ncbi:MAG: C4-type zinc ribbon domain-containing protein [Candidatus Krumholzibacteria bacterium]|nr:C4-type zinc ribbon domain-containing protein [Candidatus Krumholzibacteria bacterium]
MADIRRELHVLISIAKLDHSLNEARVELGRLPVRVESVRKSLREIENREADSKSRLDDMAKQRRILEQQLEDNEEKLKKYKVQLMEVKTNKEYTAMLHEIDHLEKDTEAKEERLLILMDQLDGESNDNESYLEKSAKDKAQLVSQGEELEKRISSLEQEMQRLRAEKPKLLAELDPGVKKRYERTLAKLHDFAVTHVVDETCQGCFTRIPPQIVVEVKNNDRLITCEACGRMLVYYHV